METARAPDILHARSELLVYPGTYRTNTLLIFLLLRHTRDEREAAATVVGVGARGR